MKVLVVPPQREPRIVQIEDGLSDAEMYGMIRHLVGCVWIQAVPISPDCHGYVDKQGRSNGLPFNPLATAIAHATDDPTTDDTIVGTMVLFGSGERPGEASVPDDFAERIITMHREVRAELEQRRPGGIE